MEFLSSSKAAKHVYLLRFRVPDAELRSKVIAQHARLPEKLHMAYGKYIASYDVGPEDGDVFTIRVAWTASFCSPRQGTDEIGRAILKSVGSPPLPQVHHSIVALPPRHDREHDEQDLEELGWSPVTRRASPPSGRPSTLTQSIA